MSDRGMSDSNRWCPNCHINVKWFQWCNFIAYQNEIKTPVMCVSCFFLQIPGIVSQEYYLNGTYPYGDECAAVHATVAWIGDHSRSTCRVSRRYAHVYAERVDGYWRNSSYIAGIGVASIHRWDRWGHLSPNMSRPSILVLDRRQPLLLLLLQHLPDRHAVSAVGFAAWRSYAWIAIDRIRSNTRETIQ